MHKRRRRYFFISFFIYLVFVGEQLIFFVWKFPCLLIRKGERAGRIGIHRNEYVCTDIDPGEMVAIIVLFPGTGRKCWVWCVVRAPIQINRHPIQPKEIKHSTVDFIKHHVCWKSTENKVVSPHLIHSPVVMWRNISSPIQLFLG